MNTQPDGQVDGEYLLESFEFLLNDVARDTLSEMRFYLSTMEGYVVVQLSSAMASLESDAGRLKGTRREDFITDNYPFHWEDIIAFQLRQSFVVSLISFVEHHAGMIAHLVGTRGADARLEGRLERNRVVLETAGFARPTESEWQALFAVRDVRNCVVHCNGWIEESRKSKRLLELVSKTPGLSESSGTLGMSAEYPRHAMCVVDQLVTAMYEEGIRRYASTGG